MCYGAEAEAATTRHSKHDRGRAYDYEIGSGQKWLAAFAIFSNKERLPL